MSYGQNPRVFADQGEREVGSFGYRWGYACDCGAKFNDMDIQYGQRGDGYCPNCRQTEFNEIKGPRVFRRTRSIPKQVYLEVAA